MVYNICMEFIETPVFTKWITEIMSDDSYHELQKFLAENPEYGKVIPGCNGIRKVRWYLEGRGKSGGVRIIYYYKILTEQIFMLFAYSKKEQGDLTSRQKKMLAECARGL